MPFAAATIIEVLVHVAWTAIDGHDWINPRFHHALPSMEVLLGVLLSAGLVFCPGLLDVLQSATPPPISWFETLSTTIPTGVWAVYVLVLRKDGYRPRIYVGSACATKRGARARMGEYDSLNRTLLPKYVRAFVDDGYDITRKVLLCYCPIPSPVYIPIVRHAMVAIEAAFGCIFSAMYNPNKRYGFGELYPWPRSVHSFEYDGLCSHNPLLDPVEGDLDLTKEDLQAIATATRAKDVAYMLEYGRNLRANPTEAYRATQSRNNIKQKPATKARQRAAVAAKKYYCGTCKVSCRDNASLVRHNRTPRHFKKLEMGDRDYECEVCDRSFRYKSDYTAHLASKTHIRNSST